MTHAHDTSDWTIKGPEECPVGIALIPDRQGRYLIGRRSPDMPVPGLWEFPGGKQEPGESMADCIRRELMEELSLPVEPLREIVRYRPPVKDHGKDLVLHVWLCHVPTDDGDPSDRVLPHRVHDRLAWIRREELDRYHFVPGSQPFVAAWKAASPDTWPDADALHTALIEAERISTR